MKKSAYLALFVAAIIWGVTSPVMKLTLESVPLFSLAFIRFGCASILLFPFVKNNLKIKRKDVLLLILTALFGITGVIYFFFAGVKLTTAMNSSVLQGTVPLLSVIITFFFLKGKIQREIVWGLILGFIGVVIIFSDDLFVHGLKLAPQGDFLILLSSLSFAIYQFISKKLFKTYKPLPISFYTFLLGALSFFPFAYNEYTHNPHWLFTLPLSGYVGILFGVLLSSTVAFTLWQWGLSKIEATNAGFFLYFEPLTGSVAAFFLLREKITSQFLLGSILIFIGVFISQQHHKHPLLNHIHKKKNR